MTVLVAAASKHGATGEIAEPIGADLAEHGAAVAGKGSKGRDSAGIDTAPGAKE